MTTATAKYRSDYQAPEFLIPTTELFFNLDPQQTIVRSKLSIHRNGQHDKPLTLDSEVAQVLSVKIDGQNIQGFQHGKGQLVIPTDKSEFELEVESVIDPENNSALEGLYLSAGVFCTQCEAEGFRKITPFLDRPDVLSEYKVHIFADSKYCPFVLSNGNLVEKTTNTEDEQETTYVCWHDPFPKPSYLFALVAGDFDLLTDSFTTKSGRQIALELYVDKGKKHLSYHAMTSLKKSMQWDEEKYGLEYDLDIYMIVAVDFFNMGAMENKGLNVFNTKYVLADESTATDTDYHGVEAVIAHEYFHNWTGNRVTCRDWFQLSLKEGLTVFRDQQFSADMGSEVIERISHAQIMRSHQFAEDAGPMAHPIRPDKVIEMNNFYTVTVYDKGAEVIRMMHSVLGEEGFRRGMDLYFERHDGLAVTCDDFVDAMSDATQVDLSQFSNWYSQAGTPLVTVEEEFNDGEYQLTLSQSIPSRPQEENVATLLIPVKYELLSKVTGNSISRGTLELSDKVQTFKFSVEEPCVAVLFESFSAPVQVERQLDFDDLSLIAKSATDPFCRWDAIQTFWKLAVNSDDAKNKLLEILAETITTNELPNDIKAELLATPSFSAVTENQKVIQIDESLALLKSVKQYIAARYFDELINLVNENGNTQPVYEKEQVAKRKICSVALSYLSSKEQSQDIIERTFESATNMTEKMSALNAAQNHSVELHEAILNRIEQQFSDNELVLDKLFTSIAKVESDDVYSLMEQWSQHKLFDRKNPNRMRSLYGSFIANNTAQFHHVSGRGYEFLKNILIELDAVNPQVASRMITPLLSFKRYDETRQSKMRGVLEALSERDLSKDLFEKVSAALND